MKLFLLYLFISTGILQNSAFARDPKDFVPDLEKSTDTISATYFEDGIDGLMIKTQDCYRNNTNNLFYCVYLDVGSYRINQLFIEGMRQVGSEQLVDDGRFVESLRYPAQEYFAFDQFILRVWPVLAGAGMDKNTAKDYLPSINMIIGKIVDRKFHELFENAE